MASAAVDFLLQNVLKLLRDKAELIWRIKDDVETLKNCLAMFKAFLKDCSGRSESNAVNELIKQIRDVTYKAEDAIESYVCRAALQKENAAKRVLGNIIHLPKLASIAEDIAKIKEDVQKIYDYRVIAIDAMNLRDGNRSNTRPREIQPPVVEQDNVVGFEEEAEKVMEKLISGPDELEIVSIVGMPGLGKTTLANKVYKDPNIEYKFMIRSWVYVSQAYTPTEVFLKIWRDVTGRSITDDMRNMNPTDLINELLRELQNHKYLIVLDDVWSKDAWSELQQAFPKNNKGSRILLTTRIKDVAVHAQDDRIHNLKFLTQDECWELLQYRVFRNRRTCPVDLSEVGQQIAKSCDGLPLAVVIIAGILLKNKTHKDWWDKVAEKVTEYVVRDEKQCKEVVKWSYDNLSDHLKVCFLYIGIFPEDFEIPVWKLTLLWIAEGFIELNDGKSLEETAEEYLDELVDKNLVLPGERTVDGRMKNCRVHDMMHDMCKHLATQENLFSAVKDSRSFTSIHNETQMYRRLCLHKNIVDYAKSRPAPACTRSLFSMAKEEMKLPAVPLEHNSFIPKAFRLLRVLDVTSIVFDKFPKDLIELVLLRYVAMSISFKVISSTVSKLWNLQILLLKVTSGGSLEIKANVLQMLQFRHLQTNVSTKLVIPPARTSGHPSHIQTLTSISPESCTTDLFANIPNLTKLGIKGKLATFLQGASISTSFGALAGLNYLETLKLHDDVTSSYLLAGTKQSGLPSHNLFPPNLKRLTLSNTMLDWEHMATLGLLPNLVVLKLKKNAFNGKKWKPKLEGFLRLKVLYIGSTNLEEWEASSDHFPLLEKLLLKYCERLRGIPLGFANLSMLQLIDVYCTNSSVGSSARQIQRNKQTTEGSRELRVTVYPQVHDQI